MKKKLLNNWLLKLASLLFAFSLWFIVINVTDPIDDKSFTNIPVRLVNENVLDDDKVYEVLDGTNMLRNVTVWAKSSVLRELTEDDIVAEADFNNLTATQTIEIKFYTTRYHDNVDKITGNIGFVKLNIEDKKTKFLTLKMELTGEVAEGYLVNNARPDQNRITITGPESLVSQVSSAVVSVDVTDATDNIMTRGDVVLYDAEGHVVSSDALVTSFDSVGVNVQVYATKWVPIEYNVMGTPAAGYLQTGEITANPEQILLAGSQEALQAVNRIQIPEEALNITGQSEDMMAVLDLNTYLPAGTILADSHYNGRAVVTVHIEKEYEKRYTVLASQIQIIGVPEGMEAQIDGRTEYELVLSGLQNDLDMIQENQLTGVVQIPDLLEKEGMSELKAGTYHMIVDFGLHEEIEIVTPVTVQILVTQKM